MVLKCGHHEQCMYRYRDMKGIVHKYCLACVCEKSGVRELDAPVEQEVIKEVSDAVTVVQTKKPIKVTK